MKRHILISTLLCIALSALVFAFTKGKGAAPQNNNVDIRSQSLRERAKQTGGVTATARSTNLPRYNDIGSLASASNTIVLGTVDSEVSQLLPPNEKLVVTDSTVRVQDVLKGNVQPGQTIPVRGPGGRVDLEDKTFVDVRMPEFWRNPELGKSYVFFLDRREKGYFVLRGGPQGLFEITAKGDIRPQVRSQDQLMKSYRGKDVASFLQEIRRALK